MPGRDRDAAPPPSPGPALRGLGEAVALHQAGRLDDAEPAYAAFLRCNPDDVTALVNAGALSIARGDVATALARLTRAVARMPGHAIARNNLGFAFLLAQRDAEALATLDAAVRLDPRYAQAHNNRGIALARLARPDEALAAFERARLLDPRSAEAACNAGDLHARAGDAILARTAFAQALEVDPSALRARTGHALATALAGDLDAAVAALETVTSGHPAAPEAWKTLGAVANWAWKHGLAEQAFRRALEHAPGDPEAAFGVASTLLARGLYDEGFAAFEHRPNGTRARRVRFAHVPAWSGDVLDGTLLLYAEQGLGDVVQFVRFATRARERVGRIVLLLDGYWRPLAPLLATAAGVDDIVTSEDALGGETFAACASVLSLPHLVQAAPTDDALGPVPYLRVPSDALAAWAKRMAGVRHPRVGIAWSVFARSDYGYVTRHKSIPPAALLPLLAVEGVQFVTLQPGVAGDPAALGVEGAGMIDPRAALVDFGQTAALIGTLDLVIAPDTAVAHVAGALGAPVWLLDRYNSCWRWRLSTGRTPWYPTLRIFRQQRFGDWSAPVADAAAELRALSGAMR